MPEKIKRMLDLSSRVETREDGGKMYIEGMIPYNSDSEDLGGFIERIDPSAFNKTLADGSNVYAFWAHDSSDVLASTEARTLILDNRAEGLHFSVECRADCADKYAAVKRGDVAGVSFGFLTIRDEWDFSAGEAGPAIRTLKEVRLLEISPGVAFPAYQGAQSGAALRSLVAETRSQNPKPAPVADTTIPPEPVPAPSGLTPEDRARAELEMIAAEYGL